MFDTYQMLEELGHGAYGIVTKAKRPDRYNFFAIKHIDKRKAGSRGLSEVMSEVETLRLLTHPHIVQLEEVYENEDGLWLVMEYVPGGELHAAMRARGRFPEHQVRRMAKHLLVAVDYMHQRGIVHRDLKPSNCLINENGSGGEIDLKLADFGFAVMAGSSACLTNFCGTPAYLAPEIVMDQEGYGKPVDMWAIGVILYILLSGKYPFNETNEVTLNEVICRGVFSFEGPEWESISAGAKDLISKLLVVDQTRRCTVQQALKHFWIKSVMSNDPFANTSGTDDEMDDDARMLGGRRRLRVIFRGAAFAVMAGHRLIFSTRVLALRREGLDLPILRSFSYLVGRKYASPSRALCARGMAVGNPRIIAQLTSMLESSDTVETFDVSANQLDNVELVQQIVKVASNHPSLTSLNLEGNPIPSLAGRALLRLARGGTKIRVINVNNSSTLGQDIVQQISASLKDTERKRMEANASSHRVGLGGSGQNQIINGGARLVTPSANHTTRTAAPQSLLAVSSNANGTAGQRQRTPASVTPGTGGNGGGPVNLTGTRRR